MIHVTASEHMDRAAAARLQALTRNFPVTCKPSELGDEGVFATNNLAADTVIFRDVPLAYLPEHAAADSFECKSCGAFLGSNAERLAALDPRQPVKSQINLPQLDDEAACSSCGEDCQRPRVEVKTKDRSGWDQVQLAAQLVAHLVNSYTEIIDSKALSSAWRSALDALYSPTWAEVCCDDDDDPKLAEKTLPAVVIALRAAGLRKASIDAILPTSGSGRARGLKLWSRCLGAIARNCIWVQIPSPLVFYLNSFGEALEDEAAPQHAECKASLKRIAPIIERLNAAQADGKRAREEGGDDEGPPRKRLRGDVAEEEEDADEEEEEDESEEEGEEEESDDESSDESEESDGEEEVQFEWAVPIGTGATTKTLSFSSSLFPAHKGTALYPLQSKVNHSCSPNCFLLWNRDSTVQLVAMEEIPKGTELTINYLGDKSDAYSGARRRRWLRENYGFDCACVACRSE